jgi:nitrous oxidase accessory protein NosD
LLRDHFGQHRREVSVLSSALEERVPHDLLAAPAGVPREVLLARLARRLSDHLALAEDAARWSVNSWALALGVVPDEELKKIERRTAPHAAEPQDAAAGKPVAARAAALSSTARPEAAHTVADTAAPSAPPPSVATASVTPSLVVSAHGGGDYTSINEALKHAAPGARLVVRPGVYEEGVTIDKEVEIVGDGPVEQIVVTSDAASCVRVRAARARVAGLTLRGEAGGGGGFFAVEIAGGRLLLEDCDVSSRTLSCVAAHGAATEPLIRRCRVHHGADSGLYFFDGAAGTLEDCAVYANANVGVAVTGRANIIVRRTGIHDGGNAGLAVWGAGVALLEECDIYGNRLAGVGVSDAGRLTARACRIHDGQNTGVFVHRRGDATLEDCGIDGHRETEVAVETEGRLTALRCRVRGGHGNGFFVRDGGQALIQECDVTGNAASGVAVAAGSLAAVLDCRVNANAGAGVKVAEGAAARVSDSDLTGNRRGPWDTEEGAHLEGGGNVE